MQNQSSEKHLDSISSTKTKPEEALLVANKTIICEKTPAERFVDNIDKMRNSHRRDCVSSSEKDGTVEDYSEYQEKKDLEKYKNFINSSAYDDIKEIESKITKQLTFTNVRKISGMHDD